MGCAVPTSCSGTALGDRQRVVDLLLQAPLIHHNVDMSIDLILATFAEPSDKPESATQLSRLAETVRRTLANSDANDAYIEASDESILVHLPGGTAEIRDDFARFPITDLDPLTVQVIFEVAKCGNMVLLTDGGDYSAILVEPSQRSRLPDAEWQSENVSPDCRSPEHLGLLLGSWYREHSSFITRVEERWRAESDRHELELLPPTNSGAVSHDGQHVADWVALHPSSESPVLVTSGPFGKYQWDPWVNDMVLNGPDNELIRFHCFNAERNVGTKHLELLRDLSDLCERHLHQRNEPSSKLIKDDWPPLDLRMRFYSANIWADRAELYTYQLDDSAAEFMFEIAKTADMSLILPGGVVLTDPSQGMRVPVTWRETKTIVACHSAMELKYYVRLLQLDLPSEDRGYGFDNHEPSPGTCPRRAIAVYVEAKPNEAAGTHQKKVYRHKLPRPESGMLLAEFWQLDTPAGHRFYAYSYGGAGWLDFLRDFATVEQRMLGTIVNFETFVQDDGQAFSLGACRICKIRN